MLDSVLKTFNIVPHYDLNIMKTGQTLFGITSKSMVQLEDIIKSEVPDMVLVHGDTVIFSGALAAFYNQTPIAHVEAGLRSYILHLRRQQTNGWHHFAPTNAATNLINEGN